MSDDGQKERAGLTTYVSSLVYVCQDGRLATLANDLEVGIYRVRGSV